ncbi:MAG: hypothetical protein M0C28_32500 [Candidatus Moduliflexus flocculans]|nr:hypothetical protein [Candidatus Moduliflexus flocculans]
MASTLCTRFAWRQRRLGRRRGFAAAANRFTVADDNFPHSVRRIRRA